MTIAPPPDLLASYRQVPGVVRRDVRRADGRIREHWAHAGHVIGNLGLESCSTAAPRPAACSTTTASPTTSTARRSQRPAPAAAPWALDPVPVLLASHEWAGVEIGVIQRAELLNLVLTDLYGPRELLRRGLLPAELVFGHAGFLRQCDRIRLPGSQQLFTMAVDIGRDASGR